MKYVRFYLQCDVSVFGLFGMVLGYVDKNKFEVSTKGLLMDFESVLLLLYIETI